MLKSIPIQNKSYLYIPIFLLIILFVQCLYFAWDTGQTVDETYYNGTGYPIVRYNNYQAIGEHPPLMMQLASLPLLLFQPKYPINDTIYNKDTHEINISGMGSRFLYEMGNDAQKILFIERVPMILLTLLLGYVLFCWGRQIYGIGGAILALTLFSFCPNIIANGSQLTTDMGVTTFFFIAIYRLKRFFDHPSIENASLIGLCCGLALVSKISSLLLFPSILILFLIYYAWQRNLMSYQTEPLWFNLCLLFLSCLILFLSLWEKLIFVAIGPLCLTVISLAYLQYSGPHRKFLAFLTGALWLAGLVVLVMFMIMLAHKRHLLITVSAGMWTALVVIFNLFLMTENDNKRLHYCVKTFIYIWLIAVCVIIFDYTDFYKTLVQFNVFEHFLLSFNIASTHSILGHGKSIPGSWITADWKYFFGIIAIKTPIATLFLFLIGVLMVMMSFLSRPNKAALFVPPIIYFIFASFINQIHIGVRHILPIYPFIFLIAGSAATLIPKIKNGTIKKTYLVFLFLVVGGSIGRNLQFIPHQISYFNEWINSEREGAKLIAVNVGQDNKRLAELYHRIKIPHFKIASISNNLPEYKYYGLSWSFLQQSEYENPTPGYYVLDLGVYNEQQQNEKSWFYGREPDYVPGRSLYVFLVEKPDITDA